MADFYVKASGSNTAPYDTWAKAATSLATACAATANGDRVFMDSAMVEAVTATTAYSLGAKTVVVSTADTTNMPPTTVDAGATIDSTATASAIQIRTIAGIYYGMHWKTGNAGATQTQRHNGKHYSSTFERTYAGDLSFDQIRTENCIFVNGAGVTTKISPANSWYWKSVNDSFFATGGVPNPVFLRGGGSLEIVGGDLSACNTEIMDDWYGSESIMTLVNCSLHASATFPNGGTVETNECRVFNCAAGDNHYAMSHKDYWGSTNVLTSKYVTADGASYDGTNKACWVVAGSTRATVNHPYKSPWIEVYHDGVAAITPYLEILRDGSATPYTNAEVWVEFSYQGNTGSTKASFVNDSSGILGTPANQTNSALATTDWTGAGSPAWSGKVAPTASITPAEIGPLMARVCIAGNFTVYVDPQIRGRV